MNAPVVIVSGLPRSGTSLMMRILEAAGLPILQDGARPPDDSNPHGYFEHSAVARTARDASWLKDAPGHAVKVIHALVPHLPRNLDYSVVLMRRPVAEVVASQDRMLARLGQEPGALTPDRVAQVLGGQLDATIALLDREICFRWIGVEFHRIVEAPEASLAPVIEFLGLDAAAAAADLARLVDPALHRQRGSAGRAPSYRDH